MEEKTRKKTKKQALAEKHYRYLWTGFVNIFLGFWLILSHIAFGTTCFQLAWNDIITGIIIATFGALSLSKKMIFAPWVIAFTGIWLQFAPLLYWAPDSVSYANDTIVGVLVIVFSILIPGIPGMVEPKGKNIPPGWSYNPSSWIQRIPVITLGCVGWFISRYLAAYQLGYIDTAWDPVFGDGTRLVITSSVASFFPVPDAGLGAFAYTLEVLMGIKGGENRWRTMPWMVVAFAMLVVPLGVVSIILVILQPLLVGHWCFLCLLTAGSMLIMVVLTVDEMIAVLHFLYHAWKEGQPIVKVFFFGGEVEGIKEDRRTPSFDSNPLTLIKTFHWGIGFHIPLILTALLGGWLMFTPFALGLAWPLADSDHLVGAITIVISVISLAEVTRSLRFLLVPLGLWIAIFSWFTSESYLAADLNHLFVGIGLIVLSLPRGKVLEKYGSYTKLIK